MPSHSPVCESRPQLWPPRPPASVAEDEVVFVERQMERVEKVHPQQHVESDRIRQCEFRDIQRDVSLAVGLLLVLGDRKNECHLVGRDIFAPVYTAELHPLPTTLEPQPFDESWGNP